MQPDNRTRWLVTLVMWFAAAAVSWKSLDMVQAGGFMLESTASTAIIASMLAALLGTVVMWGLPELAAMLRPRAQSDHEVTEKNKRDFLRGDQMALMMSLLDDDEWMAFKAMLHERVLSRVSHDDGELPLTPEALEAMMSQEQSANGQQ